MHKDATGFDARGFIEYLLQRKKTKGLKYFYETDRENHLERAFVEVEGGKALFETNRKEQWEKRLPPMFDATFGTKKYAVSN